MPIPVRFGYNMAMEGLLSLMSTKVEAAVEYAASASIYSAKTTVDELTTAQTLVVSLFHGLLYGDIPFCSAVLQLKVEQLKSSYLNVRLRDDFLFSGHDVQMVMAMLSFLFESSRLRFPVHVLWIFGSLVAKYGVADCCTEDLLAAFGDQCIGHSPAPKVPQGSKQFSFIRKLRSSLRRSPPTPQNVPKKNDEEFVIVNSDNDDLTINAIPPTIPLPENRNDFKECNSVQANKANSNAKLVPRKQNQDDLGGVRYSEPVPQVLQDPGIVSNKSPVSNSPVKEVKVVYRDVKTLLLRLAQIGRTAAMERLLVSGTPVDICDQDGKTALHWAAQYNQFGAARLLLNSGANVNALCNKGRTPLSYVPFNNSGVSDIWGLISEAGGTV